MTFIAFTYMYAILLLEQKIYTRPRPKSLAEGRGRELGPRVTLGETANEVFVEHNGQKVCIRKGRYYTKDHVWVEVTPNNYFKVGVTDYAQKFLRELVSLVTVDKNDTTDPEVREGEKFGTIFGRYYRVLDSREYGCTIFDLIAPVSGRIVEINNKVMEKPELINKDPYGEGWIVLVEIDDVKSCCRGLITFEGYKRVVADKRQSPFREL